MMIETEQFLLTVTHPYTFVCLFQRGTAVLRASVHAGPYRGQLVRFVRPQWLQTEGGHAFHLLRVGRRRLVLAPVTCRHNEINTTIQQQQQQQQQLHCQTSSNERAYPGPSCSPTLPDQCEGHCGRHSSAPIQHHCGTLAAELTSAPGRSAYDCDQTNLRLGLFCFRITSLSAASEFVTLKITLASCRTFGRHIRQKGGWGGRERIRGCAVRGHLKRMNASSSIQNEHNSVVSLCEL